MSVLVVGEALVDVVRRADGSGGEHPGGSPANVALGLGRLGRDVLLLTDLGDDDRGRNIRDWLAESGARIAPTTPGRSTSTATAVVDAEGSATYDFDLGWDPVADVDATAYDLVHTGSIAAVLEPGAATVTALLDRVAATATITYDPNARPAIMGDRDAARERIEALVARADVVKVSDEDLAWLHPGADPAAVIEAWRLTGPAVVVVTRGGDGITAVCAAGRVDRPVVEALVVDTVGAGDTFMAALIDGLIELGLTGRGQRPALDALPVEALERVLDRAARAAAINVARPGADPPTRAELGSLPTESA